MPVEVEVVDSLA